MRKVIALIGTVGMALTGTNLAIAEGTDSTQAQVHALAKTESQLVALLHGFKDTATWKEQYQELSRRRARRSPISMPTCSRS